MTKINTDQNEFKIIEDSKDEPSLKEAQDFVGGYVEGITLPNGDYLIVNEEGKLKDLPLNPEATALWKATFDNDQYMLKVVARDAVGADGDLVTLFG